MLQNTKLYQELQNRESKYLDGIEKVYKHACDILPKINRIFANYTGHGIDHSIHVMEYMYDLVTDISQISELDITCLMEAALLHDIGMAANESEIAAIKKDELSYHGRKYSAIFDKCQDEIAALQECVRPVHGERSYQYIMQMQKEFFIIPEFTNCNFQEELAKICQAHTMDQEWLLQNLDCSQVKGKDELNAQYVAMLLRVADYLDIDEKRAPIELYKFLSPEGFGDEEWRQHYIIENTEKVVRNNTSGSSSIVIYGKCSDAKIHRKFLRYLSNISEELLWCTSYTRKHYSEKYWLLIQPQIDNRIITEGFEISDLKMQLDYHAIITLLMGENVYGDKKCGLRELIQNAVDACRVMVEEAEHMEKYRYNPYLPVIQIIIDHRDQKLIVMDNGIGMNNDVLTKYFLAVGKSYYRSNEFLYQGKKYNPIGTYGIGFLACFMLSNSVAVETKHYIEQEGFTIELEKDSEYICKKNYVRLIRDSGTAIILNLDSVLESFEGEEKIREYLEDTFLDQGVQVRFITIDNKREEKPLKLRRFDELIPDGIRLDSYLNGISVQWNFRFDNLKASRKFSSLCLDDRAQYEERIYATINSDTNQLCIKDIEGKGLQKYIVDNCIMILRIKAIKEEANELYIGWKRWHSNLDLVPARASKYIYVPLKYDKSLIKDCSIRMLSLEIDNILWHNPTEQTIMRIINNIDLGSLLRQCKLIREGAEILLGVCPVININNEYYIKHSNYLGYSLHIISNDEYVTYWHGIKLGKAVINPDPGIYGVRYDNCVINISDQDILTNVARDDLLDNLKDLVTRAIERAALQYIFDNISDRKTQRALQLYINSKYSEDNPYIRKP